MASIAGIRTTPAVASAASSKSYVDAANTIGTVPAGTIAMLAHASIPAGWFLCDGTQYSTTTYATLSAVIGTAYNTHPTLGAATAGNFRVPDFRDLFLLGSATLGTYSTTGWNHTHTVPAHAHTLGNHTHTLGSHSHTFGASHTHTLNNHTHTINNHSHTFNSHNHSVPAHTHGFSLSVTVNHTHIIDSVNTGTVQTTPQDPRAGNLAANGSATVASATLGTPSAGGTVGSGVSGDAAFTTSSVSAATGASNPTSSANNDASGGPSSSTTDTLAPTTGAPSSNTTSTDAATATVSANPPYFGLNFIIKY